MTRSAFNRAVNAALVRRGIWRVAVYCAMVFMVAALWKSAGIPWSASLAGVVLKVTVLGGGMGALTGSLSLWTLQLSRRLEILKSAVSLGVLVGPLLLNTYSLVLLLAVKMLGARPVLLGGHVRWAGLVDAMTISLGPVAGFLAVWGVRILALNRAAFVSSEWFVESWSARFWLSASLWGLGLLLIVWMARMHVEYVSVTMRLSASQTRRAVLLTAAPPLVAGFILVRLNPTWICIALTKLT